MVTGDYAHRQCTRSESQDSGRACSLEDPHANKHGYPLCESGYNRADCENLCMKVSFDRGEVTQNSVSLGMLTIIDTIYAPWKIEDPAYQSY